MPWTADDLVTAVQRRGQFPDANGSLSSTDILALADETMLEDIEPVLTKPGSEYWLQTEETNLVANQAAYRLPKRAIASKLRDLWYIDASGNERLLDQVAHENAPRPANTTGTDPTGYYLRGEHVVLLPTPSAAGGRKVRMRYYLRRPRLVLAASAPRITDVNFGTKVITATAIPSAWTDADSADFIRFGGLFDHLQLDNRIAAIGGGGTTITMTSDLPADLVMGDYVSLAGESSVLCIPVELHPCLTTLTLARCLRAIGDVRWEKEYSVGLSRLEALAPLFAPRVDSSQPPILPRFSPLRNG